MTRLVARDQILGGGHTETAAGDWPQATTTPRTGTPGTPSPTIAPLTTPSDPGRSTRDDAAALRNGRQGRDSSGVILSPPETRSRSSATVTGSPTRFRAPGENPAVSLDLPGPEPASTGPASTRSPAPADDPPTIGLPLPVPRLTRRCTTTARYAITSCDRQGRLADRSPVKAVGWTPRHLITMTAGHNSIVVRATTDGQHTLTPQGFLRLPAAIRHRCHIHPGDRLLAAAYPGENLILICTLAVLDEFLSSSIGSMP